jgi:thioredoxin 1
MNDRFQEAEPTRAEIDAMSGPVVVEFGASWCGFCTALRPHLSKMLTEFADIRHVRVEDGPGEPLGRSFQVKLWPTLVLLRDGQLLQTLVRPSPAQVRAGLEMLTQTQ